MRDSVMIYLNHKAKRELLAEMLYTRLNDAGNIPVAEIVSDTSDKCCNA